MKLFNKLKSIFPRRKEAPQGNIIVHPTHKISSTQTQPHAKKIERQKYQWIPRTSETQKYVNSLVKKAYTPDPKPRPSIGSADLHEIERITNKIKEDFSKKR